MGVALSSSPNPSKWQPSVGIEPRKFSRSGFDVTPMTLTEQREAADKLSPSQRDILLHGATERAFSGKTLDGRPYNHKGEGVYLCALGGLPLFDAKHKYDSGTGWPSFSAPIDSAHIIEAVDNTIMFMPRTEVICSRSGAHLGHVFEDGPPPTGRRYCINAAALRFVDYREYRALPKR